MNDLPGKVPLVACPNCGAELLWDSRNKHRPFCSERCKMMDLGQWAAERYRVAGEKLSDDPVSVPAEQDYL
jgi:endogenous inhibitor of DNA gyrase (YacG/DUF329 family)